MLYFVLFALLTKAWSCLSQKEKQHYFYPKAQCMSSHINIFLALKLKFYGVVEGSVRHWETNNLRKALRKQMLARCHRCCNVLQAAKNKVFKSSVVDSHHETPTTA